MPEIKKSFVVTVDYTEEDLQYIAEQQGLSLEQLTDEKLAEFLAEDMTDFIGCQVSALPHLTPQAKS
jgi:hypothetical protein